VDAAVKQMAVFNRQAITMAEKTGYWQLPAVYTTITALYSVPGNSNTTMR
jgi:hypothetical protein